MSNNKYSYSGWFICALGALFYCYEYFLRITPSVMTNDLMLAFNINASLLGNLAAFYYYAYTPMQIPVGIMMDRYGPKRLIIFAIQMCGLGMLLFGSPSHFYLACFGRFLVGFGSAFAFVGVLKLASMWLPLRFFGLINGITNTLGMLGGMFGSIYLENIVVSSGWQATIKISAAAAFILAAFIGFAMPHKPTNHTDQEKTLTFQELFSMLWKLIKHPIVWLNGIAGCMLYLSLSVFAELWGPKYLAVTHHLSSQAAVKASSVVFLAWTVGAPIIGILAKDLKRSLQILIFGSIVTGVFSALLVLIPNLSLTQTEVILFIFALGSACEILVFNVVRMTVSADFAGTAIAFTNMLVMLGGSIFEPFVGGVLDWFWQGQYSNGIKVYPAAAFNKGLMILPVGALISLVALVIIYILIHRKDYQHSV